MRHPCLAPRERRMKTIFRVIVACALLSAPAVHAALVVRGAQARALFNTEEVLADLQKAFGQVMRVLDMNGVVDIQIPTLEEIQNITSQKAQVLVPARLKGLIPQKRWIRVVLPLRFDEELIGVNERENKESLLNRINPDYLVEAKLKPNTEYQSGNNISHSGALISCLK